VRFDDARNARGRCPDFVAHLREWGSADSDFEAAEWAFEELVGNVIRHAPGSLRIELEWSKCSPILHVLDSGPGFELAAAPPASLGQGGGGLARVMQAVGALSVRRVAEGLTRVSVSLPVHRKECDGNCHG
jgi:signal transduction histidine kinase